MSSAVAAQYPKQKRELLENPNSIGSFVVECLLGHGGFGSVFLARDVNGEKVAIKLLHPDRLPSREAFFREAVLLSQLKHPSVVSSFYFGVHEDRPFYAMDFVEGGSLAKLLCSAKLEKLCGEPCSIPNFSDFITRAALDTAKALVALHENGVLHRDFKPGNILIDENGRARLSDFGFTTSGTCGYMAPEILRGEDVDCRTDLFSFGATFYEAISLRKAFIGQNREEIVSATLFSEPLPLTEIQQEVSPDFWLILQRCVAKKREDRYRSALDLVADLELFLQGQSVNANCRPSGKPKKSLVKVRVGGIFALALGVTLLAASNQSSVRLQPTPDPKIVSMAVSPGPAPAVLKVAQESFPQVSTKTSSAAFSMNKEQAFFETPAAPDRSTEASKKPEAVLIKSQSPISAPIISVGYYVSTRYGDIFLAEEALGKKLGQKHALPAIQLIEAFNDGLEKCGTTENFQNEIPRLKNFASGKKKLSPFWISPSRGLVAMNAESIGKLGSLYSFRLVGVVESSSSLKPDDYQVDPFLDTTNGVIYYNVKKFSLIDRVNRSFEPKGFPE